MALDPRTPVIVGAGQLTRRPDTFDLEQATEPAEMMAETLRRAEADAGTSGLLAAADSVRVVDCISWKYPDPGAAVAQRVGAHPKQTVYTSTGGNSPQMLLNHTALAISRGEVRVALVTGAEAVFSRRRARQTGTRLDWSSRDDAEGTPGLVLGDDRFGSSNHETTRGLMAPIQVYPLFENALRAAAGETIDEHQVKVSELWARFTEVASRNPHAWSPTPRSAEEIRTVTPDNRMVGFPYPKLMNSNIDTDQAAGLILCSVEAARELGVPEDRWVFPHSGTDAKDHWFFSERENLHSSPAIRIAGAKALELAGVGADDLTHVDLYSCFPSAVQIGAAALGLGLDRPLTVTGGLCFAGGPGSNYATHSVAAMVGLLRDDPDAIGLCSALGWYVTKHAIGIYSAKPPAEGFRHDEPQAEVDATPRREVVEEHDGPVTIETYTVMHAREGHPENGIFACLLDDGRRALGTTTDPDLMKAMTVEDLCGRPGTMRPDGTVEIS
jgi:acetyl-CoA C-acetyltransferase